MPLFQKAEKFDPEADQAAIDQALDALRKAEQVVAGIVARHTAAVAAAAAQEAQLGQLALASVNGGADEQVAFEVSTGHLADERKEAARLSAALQAARSEEARAKAVLHQASIARTLKTHRRLTQQRAKHAAFLAEALNQATKEWAALCRVNNLIRSSWPGGQVPRGAALDLDEIKELVALELLRLAEYTPLKRRETPCFPNTETGRAVNASTLTPMVDAVEAANARLITVLQQVPS